MINLYKASGLFFFITLMLIGCTKENNINIVNITIHATGVKAGEVELNTVDVLSLESSVLAEPVVDPTGASVIRFNLSKPLFGYLKIGEQHTQVLLSPGYDLHVYVNGKSATTPIQFAGKGSEANNYLAHVWLLQNKFENRGGKEIFQLNPQAFLARLDSMEMAFANFYRHYTDSTAIPKDISTLLEGKTKFKVLYLKQNYALGNFEQLESTDPGIAREFENVAAEVSFDNTALNSGLFEYAFSLHMYMDEKFYGPLASAAKPRAERSEDNLLTEAYKIINQGDYPAGIKAFFMAKIIYRSINDTGITPGINTIFTDFKRKYGSSPYVLTLEKRFNQWLAISAGKIAPQITGIRPDGIKIKLSDLKGKVVYIDVWATWCIPCLKEMPYAKKLAKQFEKNKQVVFLYVSVDENKQAWEKMVAADKELKGIHILDQSEGKTASIWDTYLIRGRGIPRYMLIDQEGKIVQADAVRPSSGKVFALLEEILGKQKVAVL